MKHLVTLSMTALALVAAPVFAADASGKWEAKIEGPRGEMAFVFNLTADGETLTGTVSNEMMGESEISDGKVSGDEISFKQKLERGERTMTFAYKGKVNGDELELTRTVEGMGGGKKGGMRPGGGQGGGQAGGQGGAGDGGPRRGGMGREMTFVAKRIN
ncbi:MAG: hypothetical protein GC160_00595 [Acidobacteria bacterium]|nr:hypothetical protein [Acidobacteriota bacterium]